VNLTRGPKPGLRLEFSPQKELLSKLRRLYVVERGYFYHSLCYLDEFDLHGRVSWKRFEEACLTAIPVLGAGPPFILFNDRIAGWRGVPRKRERSPIRSGSFVEALGIIRLMSHFRDGTTFADNYYIANRSMRWFMCFCHEAGWHLWIKTGLGSSLPWRRWRRQTGARWELGRRPK